MKVEISTNSYSEEIKLNCPVCTETVKAEIWLIIDVIERMDLAALILEGSLNSIKCTKCGNEGLFDAPLLLFNSDQRPPLIFSQSNQATEESREEAFHLMSILKNRMGKTWRDEWISDVCAIKHQFLAMVLSEWLNRGVSNKSDKQPAPKSKISLELQAIFEELARPANQSDMEHRAKLCRQALSLVDRKETPELWAMFQGELGNNLAQSYSLNRKRDIELSIKASKQALEVYRKETMQEEWAGTMNNLAVAYSNRIEGIRENNIELSIEICREVLEVCNKQAMPMVWIMVMDTLASAYSNRVTGYRKDNIELSIEAYRQILEVCTKEKMPFEWARTMNNLGFAYKNRIKGDRADNIELSIEIFEQILKVFSKETLLTRLWIMVMINLSTAYGFRIKGTRIDNIEISIKILQEILGVCTKEVMPVLWVGTMGNLATAYMFSNRIKGDREEHLQLAIKICKEALKICRKEEMPFEWALLKNTLGNAYSAQTRGNKEENIELSIEVYREELEVCTKEMMPIEWAETMYNLGFSYSNRIKEDKTSNIKNAISFYELSLEIFSPYSVPHNCRLSADRLAHIYFQIHNWDKAVRTYKKAIEAAENLYRSSILRYSKEAELTENRDLYHLAAYSFARNGNLKEASVILERAKAHRLSEVLERERTDLEQIREGYPDVYKFYQDAVINLRQLENEELREYIISPEYKRHLTSEDIREWANKAKTDLDAAIKKINAIPGYEKFLAQPDFDDIGNALKSDSPLVYLVTTPAGSLSLIISKFADPEVNKKISIEPIWSDSFTQTRLTEFLDNWFNTYRQIKIEEKTSEEEKRQILKPWLETIEKTTRDLWEHLMGEVIQHLLQINAQQAVLIPMGYLALLPLHSAWTELDGKRHYALDDVTFTYAPSAVALSHSRQIAEKVSSQQLLAVVEPKPVTAYDLPNANIEADAVASLFSSVQMFKHEDATRSAVLEKLPEADIVHFSCHGATNLQEPLKSGLLMAEDEMITAGDLFQLGLKGARMAVLSACETGIVGLNLPDEAIGLPAAFLQAGFAGVVASLWLVDDLSTAMLMERFYQLWRSEGIPPAQALQKAQQWLRDTTNKEKADYFGKDLFSIFSASSVRMSGVTATEFYDRLSYDLTDEYKFEHPFYWAAFSLTGV